MERVSRSIWTLLKCAAPEAITGETGSKERPGDLTKTTTTEV